MSLKALAAVWSYPPVGWGELLWLLAIADNADDEGNNAYPSMKTIARKCKMSERNARRCVQGLEDKGLISIDAGRGRNRTN